MRGGVLSGLYKRDKYGIMDDTEYRHFAQLQRREGSLCGLRYLLITGRSTAISGGRRSSSYAVDALICGGIGAGARLALAEAGIRLYPGAEGGADDAVRALLAGALHYQPDYVCGHHKDEPPRVCGSHTCSAACYHETSEERSE